MKFIKKDNKIVAMIFGEVFEEGTRPLTDPSFPLQILGFQYPKGKVFPAHIHKPVERQTSGLMEALVVATGLVKVTIFHEKQLVESIELSAGQGILMIDGGYGIEVLQDAQMFEFKNGPFKECKEFI